MAWGADVKYRLELYMNSSHLGQVHPVLRQGSALQENAAAPVRAQLPSNAPAAPSGCAQTCVPPPGVTTAELEGHLAAPAPLRS